MNWVNTYVLNYYNYMRNKAARATFEPANAYHNCVQALQPGGQSKRPLQNTENKPASVLCQDQVKLTMFASSEDLGELDVVLLT